MGFGKLTGSQGQTSCDSVFVDSVAFRGLTLTPFLLVAPDFCTALRPLTRNPPHSSIGPSDHPPEGRGALSWSPPLGEREGMTHHTRRPRKLCILLWGSGQFPSSSGVSRGRGGHSQGNRQEYSLSGSSRRLHEPAELSIASSSSSSKGPESACVRGWLKRADKSLGQVGAKDQRQAVSPGSRCLLHRPVRQQIPQICISSPTTPHPSDPAPSPSKAKPPPPDLYL